jgi:hypothetical protein
MLWMLSYSRHRGHSLSPSRQPTLLSFLPRLRRIDSANADEAAQPVVRTTIHNSAEPSLPENSGPGISYIGLADNEDVFHELG